ncbi:MAG TPA: hypothetical protein VGF13_00660, partial [Verrucomicrobiae bacterium]
MKKHAGLPSDGANGLAILPLLAAVLLCFAGCAKLTPEMKPRFESYTLAYDTRPDSALQASLEAIDTSLRARYGISTEQTAVGLLDLKELRLA